MSNYLNESNLNSNFPLAQPLTVKKSKWLNEEKKMKIVYDFKNRKQKESFVVELLKYLREAEVDLEFRIRQNNVAVVIHAYSSQISELEIDASKDVDKIKKDVMYYYAEEKWAWSNYYWKLETS